MAGDEKEVDRVELYINTTACILTKISCHPALQVRDSDAVCTQRPQYQSQHVVEKLRKCGHFVLPLSCLCLVLPF